MLSVRSDFKDALRAARDIPRHQVRKIAIMAINRVLKKVRTRASREIAGDMGLKRTKVLGQMRIIQAGGPKLFGEIRSTGKKIGLINFQGVRQTRAGVRAKAWGKSTTYDGAFIAPLGKGKHRQVVTRERIGGRKVARLKIRKLLGPSIPQTMATDKVKRVMNSYGLSEFRKEFSRLLRVRSGRPARRVLP